MRHILVAKDTVKEGCKILNEIFKINTMEITRDIVAIERIAWKKLL